MDDYVQEIGRAQTYDGNPMKVKVDYDTVVLGESFYSPGYRMSLSQAEEFASLFVAACWQAGRNAALMASEAVADARALMEAMADADPE